MADKLTERERRAVEAFFGPAKGNKSEACRIAGYKTPNVDCTKVFSRPRVRRVVEAQQTELAERATMNREEMLRMLEEQFIRPVKHHGTKIRVTDKLKAMELEAKLTGMFRDQQTGPGVVIAVFEGQPEQGEKNAT